MKLLLRLTLVALGHVGFFFCAYGTLVRNPSDASGMWIAVSISYLFLLCSPVIAFSLYYRLISRSNLLSADFRRTKATFCSIGATLVSFYRGMFFSLNTFGS
jgi:hypothetical protein